MTIYSDLEGDGLTDSNVVRLVGRDGVGGGLDTTSNPFHKVSVYYKCNNSSTIGHQQYPQQQEHIDNWEQMREDINKRRDLIGVMILLSSSFLVAACVILFTTFTTVLKWG